MKRLLVLAAVCSLIVGFTSCDPPPKLSCSNPTKLTDYQGTLSYPGGLKVQQNVWSPRNGTKQTMYVCSPASWKAVVNQTGQPSDGVATYPDSARTFTDWSSCASAPTLSAFTKLVGHASHVAPNSGSYNAAWDIFVGGTPCATQRVEIMVWDQFRDISVVAGQPVTIDGVAYDLYANPGSAYYQFRRHTQTSSATVDLLAILRYCEGHGFLPAAGRVQFAQYGYEILTTYGANLPFWLTGFSVSSGVT